MFTSNLNHNFTITFENGLCISVAFGPSNYCERRYCHDSLREDLNSSRVVSKNAEIAIWNTLLLDDNDFQFEDLDIYKGHVKPDEVAKWIFAVSQASSLNDIHAQVDYELITLKVD